MGIGITTSYNMLLFAMGLGNNVMVDMNIFLNILASGIVGPIFEEILFRYSFVNSLKKFNAYLYLKKKDILIPIVIHMSANIFVNILNSYNLYVLVIGIFLVILSTIIIRISKD